MSVSNLLWLMATMVVLLTATSFLRAYVDHAAVWMVVLALGLYSVGNLMMIPLLRGEGMAAAISIASVLQLVMANGVAVAVFGERPSLQQWIGIGLGVAAVMLIATAKGEGA